MGQLKEKQEKRTSVSMDQMAEEFANVYFVKLLFQEPVEVDAIALQQALRERFGDIDVVLESDQMKAYALLQHPVTYQDGQMPSQISILDVIPFDQNSINSISMSQCWGLDQPEELLSACHYELMIHDFLASGHDRLQRCNIIASFVDVMLQLFPQCIALYWPHAQKFLSREQYEQTNWMEDVNHFLDGGLLIRFFNIQDTEDMVVDTLGLQAIGLSDLQCHYHDLDPNDVVRFVGNLACYMFQEGDVILDGETVDGFSPEHARWICQHEDALIAPQRVVLDVNMLEYSAGNRN